MCSQPLPTALGDIVADRWLRERFVQLLGAIAGLSGGVLLDDNGVEVICTLDGAFLCRVVPYRELVHLQVGEDPAWELRMRDEAGYVAAVDRVVECFLALSARAGGAAHLDKPLSENPLP